MPLASSPTAQKQMFHASLHGVDTKSPCTEREALALARF